MHPSTILPALFAILSSAQSVIKTSIWIDQIPSYSSLAPCAENKVSAIVRAQASGCGDDQQLTSFGCFCIDQSSKYSSIISTAVENYCAASATTLPASATTAMSEVTDAIKVFNSYCARSTELAWYQANSTALVMTEAPTSPFTVIATPISSPSPQASSSSRPVPVAAIAAPVVIGVLAIAGIVGLLFFLRRRKAASKKTMVDPYAPPMYTPRGELEHGVVHEAESPIQEVMGDTVKYRCELETRPAELEAEKVHGLKK